ncbi:histidine phosphatase family protein [Halotalea alkalilenta]|uniref:Phosphoglycerate mutase n=1 Tax=Halotalea alkalilenta TaxID=376489 RepID=A0A172YBZ0_9GAMM|nr:histidine phosphatase family protein [Halotalea alkalilenta]ANF56747.1 hypothetical protein A5892_04080 [Halotalea alkalilenta]
MSLTEGRPCIVPGLRGRVLLMRHAHSEANAAGLIISDPRVAVAHYGLSERGRAQLDSRLDGWRWPVPNRIVHSPFRRTLETARTVAKRFELAIRADEALRERGFGELEGGPDARYGEIWARDALDASHRDFGVESLEAVATRMRAALERWDAASSPATTLLVVSHGDPLSILLASLLGTPLGEHRTLAPLAPAGVIELLPCA